jgi:hypothetical protein
MIRLSTAGGGWQLRTDEKSCAMPYTFDMRPKGTAQWHTLSPKHNPVTLTALSTHRVRARLHPRASGRSDTPVPNRYSANQDRELDGTLMFLGMSSVAVRDCVG